MADTKPTNTRQFMNHTITLNDNWSFSVTGPEFDDERYSITFKSLEAAQQEITHRVEQTTKVAAQNATLNVRALTEKGLAIDITRINRQSSRCHPDGRHLYPNVPWVRESLARLASLKSERDEIEKRLAQVQVENERAYGRIDADRYPQIVLKTQQAFAEAKRKAEEIQQQLHEVAGAADTKPEVA
jgi:hypothetical protein